MPTTNKRSAPEIPAPAERQIIAARNREQAMRTTADITRLHRQYIDRLRPLKARAARLLKQIEPPG